MGEVATTKIALAQKGLKWYKQDNQEEGGGSDHSSQRGVVMSDHSSQRSKSHTSPRDLLVIRRMLGKIQKPFYENKRENIFHTRCLINNKLCSLIVDGGSCTNVVSTIVVEKVGLSTISHTKP